MEKLFFLLKGFAWLSFAAYNIYSFKNINNNFVFFICFVFVALEIIVAFFEFEKFFN